MNRRTVTLVLLVMLGAHVLSSSYLATALRHAGPYGALDEVRIPVVVSMFAAYAGALAVSGWLFILVVRRRNGLSRWALFALCAVGTSILIFLAPALPYLLLAGACRAEALCPQAANPIAWALSGIATSREKPFSSTWAVLALALAALLWSRRLVR